MRLALPDRHVRIIALTPSGLQLAQQLNGALESSKVLFKPKPFAETIQQEFINGRSLIFICATGIVVRTLAPVLKNKQEDPPVLVLDETGRYVIPLLSGHEGGANEFGQQIAEIIGAQTVITTANQYLNPVYAVGMGCERGCPVSELQSIFYSSLKAAGINLNQVACINSIDIKSDEIGLIELATNLGIPFITFDKDELSQVENLLSVKSDYVYNTVGVYGVAESAALVGVREVANSTPELVLNKQKNTKATCAIARAYASQSHE